MNTTIIISSSRTNPYLHERNVVTIPPNNGPIAAAIPAIALIIANAKVRLSDLYVWLAIDIVAGVINDPPIPSNKDQPVNNMRAFWLIAASNAPIP